VFSRKILIKNNLYMFNPEPPGSIKVKIKEVELKSGFNNYFSGFATTSGAICPDSQKFKL
jgi:hypothetical protein